MTLTPKTNLSLMGGQIATLTIWFCFDGDTYGRHYLGRQLFVQRMTIAGVVFISTTTHAIL